MEKRQPIACPAKTSGRPRLVQQRREREGTVEVTGGSSKRVLRRKKKWLKNFTSHLHQAEKRETPKEKGKRTGQGQDHHITREKWTEGQKKTLPEGGG